MIQVHCIQVSSHLHGNSTGKAVPGVALQGFQFCQSNVELAIINCRGQFFFILDTILDIETFFLTVMTFLVCKVILLKDLI